MIDLNWIIEAENNLTDRAKLDLGDNYMLSVDLLDLFHSVESFSRENEVSHYFDIQIVKDFFLAELNFIRRHSLVAFILIRHALESLVLFTYSMEYNKECNFGIKKDKDKIIEFDENLLNKANKYIEKKYPEYSKEIEAYKNVINIYYSHSNIFSSQDNTAIIEERIKLLIFDNYYDENIRSNLCMLNDIMCITMKLYLQLKNEYNSFILKEDFEVKLKEYLDRHSKNTIDNIEKYKKEEIEYPLIDKMMNSLDEKYRKLKCNNK